MSNPTGPINTGTPPTGDIADADYDDPYAGFEEYTGDDWGNDVPDSSGDSFSSSGDFGGGPAGPGDMSASGLRHWLNDLKDQGVIDQNQFNDWYGQVNRHSQNPEKLAQLLSTIQAALAPPAAAGGADDPFGIDAALADAEAGLNVELKGEIDSFIEKVQGNAKLSDSAKADFVGRAEKLIADLELVKDDEEAQYGIEEDLMELKADFTTFLEMPEIAQSLANQYTNGDVSKVLGLAEKHGLNLESLPEPPNASVFEFLADLDSDIGDALEDVQDAIREKKDTDDEMVRRARENSAEMKGETSTNGTDNPDVEAFRYLAASRYFEDSGSEQIAKAMVTVTKQIENGLEDLYPDARISTVGSDFKDADLIKFDGDTIDIISNTDGDFIAGNQGSDKDLDIPELITLEYDWEGDGDWEDTFFEDSDVSGGERFLKELKDTGYPTHAYDN